MTKRSDLIVSLMALLGAVPALAQVNLDQPLTVGAADHVFRSAVDPTVAYYIPVALTRIGEATIAVEPKLMKARFDVHVPAADIAAVRKQMDQNPAYKPLNIRFYRPVTYKVEGGTDIRDAFRPVAKPLGEIDLAGPMPMSVTIRKLGGSRRHPGSAALMRSLFGGVPSTGHIASIFYEFNAVAMGKPYLNQSQVPVFVGKSSEAPALSDASFHMAALDEDETGLSFGLVEPAVYASGADGDGGVDDDAMSLVQPASLGGADASSNAPFLLDAVSHCWGRVPPGKFCLREAGAGTGI